MSNWNEIGGGPSNGASRLKVALVAGGIILGFIVLFIIIVNIANSGTKKKVAVATSSTSTSVTAPGQTTSSTSTSTTLSTEESLLSQVDPNEAGGLVSTPAQLAHNFAPSTSDLNTAQFNKATSIAGAFATASTTGAGADQFPYYFVGHGYDAHPYVKNFAIKWVYATEDQTDIIHAQVWFTGTSLVDGSNITQGLQQVYLDETNNDQVILPSTFGDFNIEVDPSQCCVSLTS